MIRRVIASTVCGIAVTAATLGVLTVPGHAASKPDPCKLLKTSEISKQFGGATVSPGEKDLTTPVSAGCKFAVAASGSQPDGDVTVRVMTTGAKVAYAGLKNLASAGYAPVPGVANSLWNDKTKSLSLLKGNTLVTVQSLFTSLDSSSVQTLDTQAQSLALVKIAQKRV